VFTGQSDLDRLRPPAKQMSVLKNIEAQAEASQCWPIQQVPALFNCKQTASCDDNTRLAVSRPSLYGTGRLGILAIARACSPWQHRQPDDIANDSTAAIADDRRWVIADGGSQSGG
jgi:hypothetical protein